MSTSARAVVAGACFAFVAATAIAGARDITGPQRGQGGTVVQGAAGPRVTIGDNGLPRCEKPMAALAVAEPQSQVLAALSHYRLGSPVGLIRLMIQQSNCFVVVERGATMRNMMQERQLAASGETRQDSNMGGGQMVVADFMLTPSIVFSESNAGRVGGLVGGIVRRQVPVAGAVSGGVTFKEAQTSMLLVDARSGVQVGAAEGSTRKADLGLGAALFGTRTGASGSGYTNTNEGKLIAAALLDNYVKIVGAVQNDASLQRNVGTLEEEAAAGRSNKAGLVVNEGDVLVPKIANVPLLAEPREDGRLLRALGRNEELVVISPTKDGYVSVQTASASGWVRIVLVRKR